MHVFDSLVGVMKMLESPPGLSARSPAFYRAYKRAHSQLTTSRRHSFLTHHVRDRLRHMVAEAIEDCKQKMILAGSYNPYIRSSVFPPISIGLQCIVDPADVLTRARGALFASHDRHFSGICEERADPIPLGSLMPRLLSTRWTPNRYEADSSVASVTRQPWWKRTLRRKVYSGRDNSDG